MPQYTTHNLVGLIKADSKRIRKDLPKELKPTLSIIQNELSTVFGYRHFHELNVRIDNDESLVNLNLLNPDTFKSLKSNYDGKINSFNKNFDCNETLFTQLREIVSFKLIKGNENKVLELFNSEYYFSFTVKELKKYVFFKTLESSLGYEVKAYVLSYLRVVFQILEELKPSNPYEMFFYYLSYDNVLSHTGQKEIKPVSFENGIKSSMRRLPDVSYGRLDCSLEDTLKIFDKNTINTSLDYLKSFECICQFKNDEAIKIAKIIRLYFFGMNKENTLYKKTDSKTPISVSNLISGEISYDFLFFKKDSSLKSLIQFINKESENNSRKSEALSFKNNKITMIGYTNDEFSKITNCINETNYIICYNELDKEDDVKINNFLNTIMIGNPDVIIINHRLMDDGVFTNDHLEIILKLGFKCVIL